ncbi:uncharacterized protein LOC112024003 [Quercus suber]|uniref:uncharacterized protein LOC112024003 n=1 Tax=Quercus suber TaxID=58331 RepID=UPI000CE1AD66|nr:uncharacterized protein LOC112024003 [Quercus suber]
MLQFAKLEINGTVLIKATQESMGVIKHSTTLFRRVWKSKMELLEAWKLRDNEGVSSLSHFDSAYNQNRIMNILIWNCKGAMKPQFRKTVMDLVEWHSPILMVITETRMYGAKANKIIELLPFDGAAVADTIGFAGGIWLLWRTDLVNVDVLATTEQEIHAIIRVRAQTCHWLISAIYANPRFAKRCILWNNIKLLAVMHDLPWALMGDFNEVLSEEEKYGGNPVCQRRVRAIKECMDVCHMMDLGFSGPKFTWTNKREVGDLIQCRLDRCWANPEWKGLFEEANVTHLARVNSDHCPLLLKLSPNLDKALRWNKEVFGNEFVRKKQIMARLLDGGGDLGNESKDGLDHYGGKEHLVLPYVYNGQRSKNRITCIQNAEGEWIHDIDEVPSDGEIWSALKSMKPYKAPGIDGLHVGFFQRFWLVVGELVKKEVKWVFLSQKIPEYLNQTLIALIPKQIGLETISHFRPISLCNTVYKIISKIIVQRVKPLLPTLISPMQAAFLEGRRSSDNVIIA